jgi:hypothetical protein
MSGRSSGHESFDNLPATSEQLHSQVFLQWSWLPKIDAFFEMIRGGCRKYGCPC